MGQLDAIIHTKVNDNEGNGGSSNSKNGYTPVSFDGVDQGHHGPNGLFFDDVDDPYSSVSAAAFSARRTRRLYIYGGFVLALIVLVALLSHNTNTNTNTSNRNKNAKMDGTTSPVSFHARHPLAGEYHDTIELYIREDISSLSPGASDTEITTIVESIKTVRDLATTKTTTTSTTNPPKQWDITTTRLATDTKILGETTHCDTKDTSHNTPLVCTAFVRSVGTKMTLVIDEQGNIVSEVDMDALGHILQNSRSAGGTANPIESVDNNLLYLPDHPVQMNDEWESRLELQSVGDYVGTTTWVGMIQCGEESSATSSSSSRISKNNSCAVFKSSGKIYLDVRAMAQRFGTMGIDSSDMSIIDGKVSQTNHWNDAMAYFAHVETLMEFTIKIALPGQTIALIPVHETITQTTILLLQQ